MSADPYTIWVCLMYSAHLICRNLPMLHPSTRDPLYMLGLVLYNGQVLLMYFDYLPIIQGQPLLHKRDPLYMLGLVLYNGSFLCTLITYQLSRGSPCYIRETHYSMLGLVLYNGSFLCTLITYQLSRGSPCYIRETHYIC